MGPRYLSIPSYLLLARKEEKCLRFLAGAPFHAFTLNCFPLCIYAKLCIFIRVHIFAHFSHIYSSETLCSKGASFCMIKTKENKAPYGGLIPIPPPSSSLPPSLSPLWTPQGPLQAIEEEHDIPPQYPHR